MLSAKESVAAYCKAQADIIKIEKTNEDQRKMLSERIKTCRSLITDALTSQNINCLEVYHENDNDPMYFRLKPNTPAINITIEDIMEIMSSINKATLRPHAEKHQNDLPKMVSSVIQDYVREQKKRNTSDKNSLSISSNRERGYTRELNQNIPKDLMQTAKDLLSAKKELSSLKQETNTKKKEALSTQKEVEQTVKEALKTTDPQNMTTRVHMMQGDSEWVYYLRCKEKDKAQPLGIRKILPMVESAVQTILDEQGLPRQYSDACNLNNVFWKALYDKISTDFGSAAAETKTVSRLSLDRGAPRKRKS